MQDSGFRICIPGFRIQDSVFLIPKNRIPDSGFKFHDSGYRIQESGFRIHQESGSRMQPKGLGLKSLNRLPRETPNSR
jgi:hypothetical protein